MKKVYTRTVLLVLAIFLLTAIPVFARGGSAASGGSQGTAQATDKMTSIRVMQAQLDNQQVNWQTLWFFQELERDTGVRVIWDIVRVSDWATQHNLRMAAMDLPDLFRGMVNHNVEEYGVQQKLLVPLDSYLQANMPNYYSRLFMNDADKPMYASDGHMYWIGNLTAQNVNHQGNYYINKTWLDRVGMAIPRTVDELTAVLRAFRDRAPNGNAQAVLPMSGGGDTKAITDQTQGITNMFAMFGVPFYDNNGSGGYAAINGNRVQWVGDYPGFRDGLTWLAMCYSERLLDMESLTQDSNAWGIKMNAGNVGFTAYLRLINTALTAETGANFVSIIPPRSNHGVQVPRLIEVPSPDATITVANRYIAQTLQWLDKQLETERMMVAVNGPVRAGGPIPPTMNLLSNGSYDIHTVPPNNELYNIVPVWHALFFAPGDYYTKVYNMPPHRVERYETSRAYAEAGVLETGSYTILTSLIRPNSADAAELGRLYADVDRFMQESLANFIRSGVTDASWNNFVSQARNVGVPRYVELLQKYYEAYVASL